MSTENEREAARNPYRALYQGFFIKRLRGMDQEALEALCRALGRNREDFVKDAATVVGIYDCRGRSCRMALYASDAPLAAASVLREDGSYDFLLSDNLKDDEKTFRFRDVLLFVCERELSQSGRRKDEEGEEAAFSRDEAKRARGIRGLTAIIATHDFIERPGTHYED